jgi:hypothetical protein
VDEELEKDLEGNDHDLIEVLSQHLPGETEKYNYKSQSGEVMPPLIFERSTCRMRM